MSNSDFTSVMRFCKKCGCDTERYANGKCKVCQRLCTKNWRAANPSKVKQYIATYRAANRKKATATTAAWRLANPESRRVYDQNRRARKSASGGSLSKDISERLFALQRGKCACCGKPLGKNYHLDHIMPLALGGSNTDDNMQLLRQLCNNQKYAKHPVDFMQSRGFLL